MIAYALIALAILVGARGQAEKMAENLPEKARRYLTTVSKWARERAIPAGVVLAWIKLESDFKPGSYNPEKGAMLRWSEEIATNPTKWGTNPDYPTAVKIYERLRAGESPGALASVWTFGSFGLMQVSRIAAAEIGYGYAARNWNLFDPSTNIQYGTAKIAKIRQALFPGRVTLTLDEWGLVRAAYVMGIRGAQNPERQEGVEEKKRRFFAAMAELFPGSV